MTSLRYLFTITMLSIVAPDFSAQQPSKGIEILLNPNASQNCEQNISSMETLAMLTLEATKDGGVLIVVARLGQGEQSRDFNRRRLYNVREFLKDRAQIQAQKVVAAEGERVHDLGRVEFYLGGKMVGRLLLARNKDLCLICCDERGPYYPHKDKTSRN